MKIVAGIDFGTSMSMIQTLDHHACQQETKECKPVRFTQSAQAATPTLVRVEEETGYEWFGEEAQNVNKGVMYENFKLALRSKDPQERQFARDLVERFFRYLYSCYNEEKNKLYPGAQNADEETVVGHPVQWDEEQRSTILDAARKAGFKNVRGKDEASASVLCVMTHNQDALRRAGYLQKGKPLNIMVLDMGAGTTDLAFVQVTEKDGGVDIQQQGTWPPKDYPEVFGGSRIDKVLAARMTDWLNACSLPASLTEQFIKGNYLSLKNWKEYNVSSDLEKNLTVDSCTALGMAMNMVQYMPGVTAAPFPAFGRTEYEEMMAEELGIFVRTIQSAPKELREQTDLVIVTGGNSQWYWVPEILSGENTRFGDVGLPKIKGNPQAIQKTTYPTETVSHGLVYMGKGIRFADAPKAEKRKVDSSNEKETIQKAVVDGSDENIFVEWNKKLTKVTCQDMEMLKRMYICEEVSLVVTDSGRVLSTTPLFLHKWFDKHDYSALRDITAIINEYLFLTKNGDLVYRTGEVARKGAQNLTRDNFPSLNYTIDATGQLHMNVWNVENELEHPVVLDDDEKAQFAAMMEEKASYEKMMPVRSWPIPLQKLKFFDIPLYGELTEIAVGLTRKGQLAARRPEIQYALRAIFPTLSINDDGTLGQDIVDFVYKDGYWLLLMKSGELLMHQKDKAANEISTAQNIIQIVSLGGAGEACVVNKQGVLLQYTLLYSNIKTKKLASNFIAAIGKWDAVMVMDKNGKVEYARHFMVSSKRQNEVRAWNIHDR